MFDFSLGKLLIVALIALLVLGPDKLPGAARTVGAMIRRLRSGWDSVRSEVERELEVEEIRRAARQAAADAEAVQASTSSTLKHLNDELDKVRQAQRELSESYAESPAKTDVVASIESDQAVKTTPAAVSDDAPHAHGHGQAG